MEDKRPAVVEACKGGTEISSPFFIRYFDIYRAHWKEYSIKINPEKYLINYDNFT